MFHAAIESSLSVTIKSTRNMSIQQSLSDLIRKKGLNEEILKREIKTEHCNEIAMDLGEDWEVLAPFIGISNNDLHYIKERYQDPRRRQLESLREWKKHLGSEATYAKMAHGLERIGNRKLTECLIDLLKSDTHIHPGKKFPDIVVTRKNRSSSANMILLISMRVLMLFIIIYTSLENESITHHQTPDTQSDSFATVQWSPKFKNSYNCNQSIGNDLPEIHGHFVGRKNDTKAIINKVMKANIVNINGAPGFGKSTLAIHVGYRLVENCVSVRYINVEELPLKVIPEFTNESDRKTETESGTFASKQKHPKVPTTSVTTSTSSIITTEDSSDSPIEFASSFIKRLMEWSKTIRHTSTTVLIFDNTDDIIANSFFDLLNLLVHNSKLRLHVIVVSQEKLLLLEQFDRWTVKELSQKASVELLNHLTSGIDQHELNKIAELLQGCPLAIKVIGNI